MQDGEYVDYEEFVADRVVQLRQQKGVSARDMSLSIGQSAGYINKIESRQALPSMTGFFYICEYLGVTPQDFFDRKKEQPCRTGALARRLAALPQRQLDALDALLDAFAGQS